jgi:hypothetical protein
MGMLPPVEPPLQLHMLPDVTKPARRSLLPSMTTVKNEQPE